MLKVIRNIGLAAVAAVGLAIGTSGAANADWGWHHHHYWGWHHPWRWHRVYVGPRVVIGAPVYAYAPNCFVRRTVRINAWGERVVRTARVCRY